MSRFTDLVGCRLPLQLAGMGGVGSVDLAAAVARAGGLAMVPALDAEPAADRVREVVADGGDGATVGINILMPFVTFQVDAIEPSVDAGARVVEFFYDDPRADLVERVHAAGALASWQVGALDEAKAAVEAGCDLVVVQGVEAGGHVRGTVPLLDLLAAVRDAGLGDRAVLVAAGGLATAADIARTLDAGADAVRLGTRFVATAEADAHPDYLQALLDATADDTTLTTAFGAGWPDAPHRVLKSCLDAADSLPDDAPGRYSPSPANRSFAGAVASTAMYAGTGVGEITSIEPAEELAGRLMAEAERLRSTSAP